MRDVRRGNSSDAPGNQVSGPHPQPVLHTGPVLFLGLLLVCLALVTGACGGSSSSASDATTIAALNILDNGGLHELDAAIQQGTIPPTAQTTATHLQTVTLLTPWPKALKSQAVKLAAFLGTLASVLNTDTPDMNKVRDASGYAHAGWHEFSMQAWSYLSGKAGVKN